jgi:hypothetical protein
VLFHNSPCSALSTSGSYHAPKSKSSEPSEFPYPSSAPSQACKLTALPSCHNPTEEEDGWNIVAFMGVDGNTSNGKTNLCPCNSYNDANFVEDPDHEDHPDFVSPTALKMTMKSCSLLAMNATGLKQL